MVSTPGEGTCFTVYLPAIDREAPVAPERAAAGVSGGSETILVAEDEVALRRLTERVLTDLGYAVIVAEDGVKALELFQEHRDDIDLLLVDIVMPGKGGRDVYAAVRALGSEVPVVFMTGYSSDVAPHALGSDTGCRVLYKPYDLDELAGVVREVLEGASV